MKVPYPVLFIPILAVLVLATVGFLGVYGASVFATKTGDPQIVAGAGHLVGATSPQEQYAAVTTGAAPLSPAEEARPLPQGQPENIPAEAPARAGQGFPDAAQTAR